MVVEILNPQHCVTCGGQDGVLVPEPGDVYVHPYCQRIVREGSEAMQTKDIRCPKCGKWYYRRHDGFIEEKDGKKIKRLYTVTAVVITCECGEKFDVPGVLTNPTCCDINT